MKIIEKLALFAACTLFISCANEQITDKQNSPIFAKGADVGWLTEMESDNVLFRNAAGEPMECMALLKSIGFDAMRFRVWVNPDGGWCGTDDVLAKCLRARELGLRIMVDFHYSDTWADPSHQTKPEAWNSLSVSELCDAVATHTTEVLRRLKDNGVEPEWVQVGNETTDGMLWEDGRASSSFINYAALTNAGYSAVKSVFPDAQVIVHVDCGYDLPRFVWLFDGLRNAGGKWDLIGMSLYPDADNWRERSASTVANIDSLSVRYGTNTIICEIGMEASLPDSCNLFITDLLNRTMHMPDSHCAGIFYWEPQAYGGWKPHNYDAKGWGAYSKGAFNNHGQPTLALQPFNQ